MKGVKTNSIEKLRFLFDEMPGLVSCIDEDGHYLFANKEFKRNYLPETIEVLGKKNEDLFSEQTANILNINNYRVFKLAFTQVFEETKYNTSGNHEYWLSIKKPIFNDNKEIEFIITFTFDITARKQFEAKLGLNFLENDLRKPINTFMYQSDHYMYLDQGAKTLSKGLFYRQHKMSLFSFLQSFDECHEAQLKCMHDLYDIIIHEFPGNVFWKSNNSELLMISKSQANDIDCSNIADAIGKTNYDYCDKKSAKALTDLDTDIIVNKKTVFVEENPILIKNSKKVVKHFLSKKKHVFSPFSQENELIGTAFDFSLRKKIEINFRQALNKKYLEQEARDTFLANISHDIRTPITGMLGLIDDIKLNSQDIPDIQENIDTLKSITNEFLNLFNGILNTVEENEANLSSTNKTIFNLEDDIKSCLTLFKPIIQDSSVKLIYDIDPLTPKLFYANMTVIKRVLINLIGNAVKFTSNGHIIIKASYKQNKLNIAVEDTGIGISDDLTDRIFDRFAKGSNQDQTRKKGYGLGLYMVKRYIEALSGTIKVKSKLGKGTTFLMSLPIEVSELNKSNLNNSSAQTVNATKELHSLVSKRVLVVEDNKLAAMALKNMLNILNYNVELAANGKDAIKLSKKERFKYIFLDLGLPDISGMDVLLSLRDHDLTVNTPVFIVSGHVTKEVRAACKASGATNTFTKPMTVETLEKLIGKATS